MVSSAVDDFLSFLYESIIFSLSFITDYVRVVTKVVFIDFLV